MTVKVDADLCIGCQACVDACEAVFEMEGDKAIVKVNPVPAEAEECAKESVELCPVDAIILE